MNNQDDLLRRIEQMENKLNQNRWTIILLTACIISLAPPVLIITGLSMVEISQEIVTDKGKISIKSRSLPENLLIKIGSGLGAITIGGLALARRFDVIEVLLGFDRRAK